MPLITFSLFHLITSGAAPRPRGSVKRPREQRLRPQRLLPPAPGPAPDVPVRFGAPLRHGLRWSPGDVPVYGSPLFTLSHYHLITLRGSRRTPHVHVPNCALLIVNCEFSPQGSALPRNPNRPKVPAPAAMNPSTARPHPLLPCPLATLLRYYLVPSSLRPLVPSSPRPAPSPPA